MQRFILILVIILCNFSGFSQSLKDEGKHCFEGGDYPCAISKYKQAILNATGIDKDIIASSIEIAENCNAFLKRGNTAFENKNYKVAIAEYNNVLINNPKDGFARERIAICDSLLNPPIHLRVSNENLIFNPAGEEQYVYVTTNAPTYNIQSVPSWCVVTKFMNHFSITGLKNNLSVGRSDYFTVTAGKESVRINVSQEGKPKEMINLSVKSKNIEINSDGGVRIVHFETNADDYHLAELPYWVGLDSKYKDWFTLIIDPNPSARLRKSKFKIVAGDKKASITVTQGALKSGKKSKANLKNKQSKRSAPKTKSTKPATKIKSNASKPKRNATKVKKPVSDCFNCPKAKNTWGLTLGYIPEYQFGTDGLQLGVKAEPLFKYGFGLNTGLNLEAYSTDIFSAIKGGARMEYYAANLPLHLEYRFNFSKWFNVFGYGGMGLNGMLVPSTDEFLLPATYEYGGGIRFNRIQFNVGRRVHFKNLLNGDSFIEWNFNKRWVYSVSFMF